MFFSKKIFRNQSLIEKKPVMQAGEKIFSYFLVALASVLLLRYGIWWFQPSHLPHNGNNTFLWYITNLLLFLLLSYVIFIGFLLRSVSWLAILFMKQPNSITARFGLRVAFITCFVPKKEPIALLEKTLQAMKTASYAHDTWVLDEGNSIEVQMLAKRLGVNYFTRATTPQLLQKDGPFRRGTKAGNLNAWRSLHEYAYDIVAQIDMDHVPQPAFLEKTLGYFVDPKVGFVGIPQTYENVDNWIARGAGEQTHFFYGPKQKGFYGSDMPFLIGTAHVYRAIAMRDIGGYAPSVSEDHLTGMKFYAKKWKGVYVPLILAYGKGPQTWQDYFNQQMRWSYGLFQILFLHTPKYILHLRWRQRIHLVTAQLFYFKGVAVTVGLMLTIMYLIWGINATNMEFSTWIGYSLPAFFIAQAIQFFAHRFHINPKSEPKIGLLGTLVGLGANTIYTIAFWKFLSGQKLRYKVTRKQEDTAAHAAPFFIFAPHLFLLLTTLSALYISYLRHHDSLVLRGFALLHVGILSVVILSNYLPQLRFNLNFALLGRKRALQIASVLFIMTIFILSYAKRSYIADAFFKTPLPQEHHEEQLLPVKVPQERYTGTMQLTAAKASGQVVGTVVAWGEKKDFPKEMADKRQIPFIIWLPQEKVSVDRTVRVNTGDTEPYKQIGKGTYDAYIVSFAHAVKDYHRPVFIAFAPEMNGTWYPWSTLVTTPDEYIASFRRVHELFSAAGATNASFVWLPNRVYYAEHVPYASAIERFYPGDDYVDWVGVTALSWEGYNHPIKTTPESLLNPSLAKLAQYSKPVVVISGYADTNEKTKMQFSQALETYLADRKQVRALLWYEAETTQGDFRLHSNDTSL